MLNRIGKPKEEVNMIEKKHITGLDGLRGIAVIGVILYHLFPNVVQGGFLGVSLFFVLSGYLIAVTSEQDWRINNFNVISFYKKRIKRIYPSLCIVVFTTIALLKILAPDVLNGIREEIVSVFMGYNNLWQISQNASYFTKISNASPFTHLWSLSIELQFYLFWPLFFLFYKFMKKSGFKKICRYAFLVPAMLSILVLQAIFQPGQDVSRVYYGTDTRIFSLFLGAFLGTQPKRLLKPKLFYREKEKSFLEFGILISVLAFSYLLVDGQASLTYRIGLVIMSLIFCKLVELVANPQLSIGKCIDCKPLAWIGKRSYEIYLWQYPVIFCFQYLKIDTSFISILMMIAVILILSEWLYILSKKYLRKNISFKKVNIVYLKQRGFRLMTVIMIVMFCLGGWSTITAPNSKQGLQEELKLELERNYQELQKQQSQALEEQEFQELQEQQSQALKEEESQELQEQQSQNMISNVSISSQSITAIGDSVMLGAAPAIKEVLPNCLIDAAESRQATAAQQIIESLENKGQVGDIVVIALGTNGSFSLSSGQSIIDKLGKNRTIYWVTVYGKHLSWQNDSNRTIYKLAEQNENVKIINWHEIVPFHPEWLYNDGIHLNKEGQLAYANLIFDSISK